MSKIIMNKIITNSGHARLQKVTIQLYIRNDYDGEPDPLDLLLQVHGEKLCLI